MQQYEQVHGYCGEKGWGDIYSTLEEAIAGCNKNIECNGVYYYACDDKNSFTLCIGTEHLFEGQSDSCVHKRIGVVYILYQIILE